MRKELPMASEPACSLPEPELRARIADWRALAGSALSRSTGPGYVTATFPRELEQPLRSLIAAEADCCSFLAFDVRERDGEIEVELRYPDGFDPASLLG